MTDEIIIVPAKKIAPPEDQGWKPIAECPWQTIVEVRNPQMDEPVLATRGYSTEIGVHPDTTFCTTVFTQHEFHPTPAGRLVCPTEFRVCAKDKAKP